MEHMPTSAARGVPRSACTNPNFPSFSYDYCPSLLVLLGQIAAHCVPDVFHPHPGSRELLLTPDVFLRPRPQPRPQPRSRPRLRPRPRPRLCLRPQLAQHSRADPSGSLPPRGTPRRPSPSK